MNEGRKEKYRCKCLTQYLALREHVTNSKDDGDLGESDKGPTLGAPTVGCAGDRHV